MPSSAAKKSGHPEVHGEALELKEPADGKAQNRPQDDKAPQGPRQTGGYAVQPQAVVLDQTAVRTKGFLMQRLLSGGLGLEGLEQILEAPQVWHSTCR
jgi:hypothetical protein